MKALLGLLTILGLCESGWAASLFTNQVPAQTRMRDGVNYELGMRFKASQSGKITAIRFYKSPGETGTHTGKIYSASGAVLAKVRFSGETASGWQKQNLETALNIAADTEYVVSVNTGNQYYVATANGLASSLSNGGLSSISGPNNGVYGAVGRKPSKSWKSTNYFRDVVFEAGSVTVPTPNPSPASCSFNGQSIASGASVTAYQASSVATGQTCLSQSRLCTNGVLSGSYAFASCTVQAQPNPTPGAVDPARFGMPHAGTTGVPAGVVLRNYTGPMSITAAGTVIENVIINGQLEVYAANVTIRNSRIQNAGWFGVEGSSASNLRVENCDIIGGNMTNSGILGAGTFIGNDISHVSIGIQLTDGSANVRDNYIHDLFYGIDDPHYDGITALGGQNGVVIEHNTMIVPNSGGTASILMSTTFGSLNNVLINNNLMLGQPSYSVYVNGTNVRVTNNYVERGYYGYYVTEGATNPVFSGNIEWDSRTSAPPYPR